MFKFIQFLVCSCGLTHFSGTLIVIVAVVIMIITSSSDSGGNGGVCIGCDNNHKM